MLTFYKPFSAQHRTYHFSPKCVRFLKEFKKKINMPMQPVNPAELSIKNAHPLNHFIHRNMGNTWCEKGNSYRKAVFPAHVNPDGKPSLAPPNQDKPQCYPEV